MTRRSTYEQRDVGRGRTIVVADGRILGTLDERGDLVPLDQPPPDRPSEWPKSWWQPVAGIERHFQRSAYQDDDALVFCHPHTGGPLDHSKVLKRFKTALDSAGVRRLRFHDLRHTFGTQMAAAGVPMRTLQEWLGHRDIKTTMIYADYQPSDQERELVERAFRETREDTARLIA